MITSRVMSVPSSAHPRRVANPSRSPRQADFADPLHCVTERQARQVREAVGRRLAEIGLKLHPDKTRIVYCKDGMRRLEYEQVSFTFCGYAFRSRKARLVDLLHCVLSERGDTHRQAKDRVHLLCNVIQGQSGASLQPPGHCLAADIGQLLRGHGRQEPREVLLPFLVVSLPGTRGRNAYPQNVNDTCSYSRRRIPSLQ